MQKSRYLEINKRVVTDHRKKVGDFCLFDFAFIYLSIYLFIHLSIYLSFDPPPPYDSCIRFKMADQPNSGDYQTKSVVLLPL